ncbi:MAG: hypothetical protein ACOYBU_13990 [Dermatophilaceae bacterium]
MSVANVTAGQPITEAWGDSVADSVNALEAADTAHLAAANPHPVYATDSDLAAHAAAPDPHSAYATDADLTSHAAAADPHTGYQRESEKGVANGYAGLDATGKVPAGQLPAVAAPGSGMTQTVNVLIDGAGAVIATGVKGDVQLDFAGTITKWALLADQSGSITVNVWKDTYGNFPPTVADVIGSPAIAGAAKAQSGAVAWAFAAGDILRFQVSAAATIQRVTLALTVVRT